MQKVAIFVKGKCFVFFPFVRQKRVLFEILVMQMNFLIIPENKAAYVFTMLDELFLAFQIFIITNIFMTYEFSLLELNNELMNEDCVLNLSVLVHDKLCDKLNDEL